MVSLLKCCVLILALSFSAQFSFAELQIKKLVNIGGKNITVEVAQTPEEQQRGLMFRRMLSENEGMLFIFKNEETRFFWMKNTLIDLSIGFFDKNGILVDVQEMTADSNQPNSQLASYGSRKPAKYALEMNKSWFDKNKIKIGQKLKIK